MTAVFSQCWPAVKLNNILHNFVCPFRNMPFKIPQQFRTMKNPAADATKQ